MERVQRRATKMIWECKDLEYTERLIVCGLTTLETRRVRADLIEVYKIVNKLEGLNEGDFFERCNLGGVMRGGTRGNSIKFFRKIQIGHSQVQL